MAQRTQAKKRSQAPRSQAPRSRPGGAKAARLHPLGAAQRAGVGVGVAGLVLLCWPPLNDIFVIPKATLLWLTALALVGIGLWKAIDDGVLRVSRSPAALTGAAVVVLMALTSAIGGHRGLSFVGEYGRNAGVLTYAAALVLLLSMLDSFDRTHVRGLGVLFAVVTAALVLYGLAELAGMEPFGTSNTLATIGSLLGQPNFLAGYLGVALPFLLWIACRADLSVPWRLAGLASAVLTGVVIIGAASFQGYVGAGASGVLFALVVAWQHLDHRRLLQVIGGGLVALLAVGIVGHGFIDDQVRNGLGERVLLWQAGGKMVGEKPLLGHGMSGYAVRFSADRPKAHAVEFGPTQLADASHDIPLGMAVGGGVLLLVAYLAMVAVGGLLAVRALRRTTGAEQLLAGAFAAGWVGFQVQSLVSIDVPTLLTVHMVLLGALAVMAGPLPTWSIPITWSARRGRNLPTAAVVARAALVVVLLFAGWQALRPWRADAAFVDALQLRADGAPEVAVTKLEQATSLASWNGNYWAMLAATYAQIGDQDKSLAVGLRAIEAAPARTTYLLSGAELAGRMSQPEVANRLFREARAGAPYLSDPPHAWGMYLLTTGHPKQALPLLEEAVRLAPLTISFHEDLASAHLALHDDAGADEIYRHILELQPGNLTARRALHLVPPGI